MCFGGELKRVFHWGPLTALGIIKFVTGTTIHCMGMWWPSTTLGGLINSALFISLSGLTLFNFLSATFHGPGYLPLNWKPLNDKDCKYLQYCGVCRGYKAPRSHHCRKCNRCVLKMDHHCPWINNCVGWGNHAHFTAFLLFAILGCLQASIILTCSLYKAFHFKYYLYYGDGQPVVYLGLYALIFCILSIGFSFGVVISVGMLLYGQVRSIVKNRTGIEDWIMEKAVARRKGTDEVFIYPYDLGFWKNISQVVNFTCSPVGDGIHWPIREGCNQYTLTKEQIEQKIEKRERARLFKIIKPASGSWFPISYGLRVCCCPPCSDEPRIKLNPGDIVSVTRWRKSWLFGEKVQDIPPEDLSIRRIRGWFPRPCAIDIKDKNQKKEA